MVILAGMFVYGDHIPASSEITYSEFVKSDNQIEPVFCSEEVEKYKKELDRAQERIKSLNLLLRQS